MRNWPFLHASLSATDGSSQVAGKFDITSIPGTDGPGVSTLGGRSLAISPFTPNKATALEFVKFFTSEEQAQKRLALSSREGLPFRDLICPLRPLDGHCCHKRRKCRASPLRRPRWRRVRTSAVSPYTALRGGEKVTDMTLDYVFVDEHNRHKRLKGVIA